MKVNAKFISILILMLLVSPLILLKGCGKDTQAPDGSKVTIVEGNVTIASPDDTVQTFHAVVKDLSGVPLNGVHVKVSGAFAAPFIPALYVFIDGPNGSGIPQLSGFDGVTDKYGVFAFSILIYGTINQQLATPVNAAFTGSAAGGSLIAGNTYCYRVSALDGLGGETLASTETCLPLVAPNNAINVNWNSVTGASGYNIYGRTAGSEQLIAPVGVATTYLDDGAVAPSGSLPTANTTAATVPSLNSFTDHVEVTTGTAFDDVEVKFNAT